MTTFQQKLSEQIRNRRTALGLSQETLAERISKSSGFIGQLERGESLPALDTLVILAEELSLDLNALLLNVEIPPADLEEVTSLMLHMNPSQRHLLLALARAIKDIHI